MEELSGFNCIGVSNDYNQLMNMILKESPDIIFINIDIENFNAFDLKKEVNEYLNTRPEFIAMSRSKEKAYESIKAGFFDYLLLPMEDLDLRKSVLRFKKKRPKKAINTICLKSYKDYRYLNVEEILFLRGDNNTTDFYMEDGSVINSFKTLKTYESILPQNFFRVHKSYIVNTNFVSRINYGDSKCTLKKINKNVPFTRFYKNNVEQMVNNLAPSLAV
ncbi:LytTR family transcriptional regulator DNA-binding domain-containing protein [Aestuariibaculum sp. M13]|uniref:LytR/AlgR family response regulator transcription factor n=1 Tax=Aestuariibaculum sp. M13 TaxID=2967132 RepID=UPI002159DA42|nr:LytTR family transcriptional regulator DNA-binding domain-containing protein [Aestuariibaculum sp. M13]MCR8667494.1 LytTR family transcriptional regulator DNA-binding domain-containing protein [Aestuariibaculum sp. M13]